MGVTTFPRYGTQLEALREAIAARPAQDWGSTVYDAWLYAMEPMFVPHGKAFPGFMRGRGPRRRTRPVSGRTRS